MKNRPSIFLIFCLFFSFLHLFMTSNGIEIKVGIKKIKDKRQMIETKVTGSYLKLNLKLPFEITMSCSLFFQLQHCAMSNIASNTIKLVCFSFQPFLSVFSLFVVNVLFSSGKLCIGWSYQCWTHLERKFNSNFFSACVRFTCQSEQPFDFYHQLLHASIALASLSVKL